MTSASTRATLEMVARHAGVSKATASKVLNRRPNVAPETRRKVEQAIHHLGYEPTTGPRELPVTPQVNVVFDTLINVYSLQVLNGILAAGQELGVETVVDVLDRTAGGSHAPLQPDWMWDLVERGRTGVIVVTSELTREQLTALREAGLSLVMVDPLNPLDDQVVSVGSTNFTGGSQATRHLVELGHRRIAFIGGPANSVASQERLQGYRAVLASVSIPVPEDLVAHAGFNYEAGLETASWLLDLEDGPTAIFAGCDASALGVLEAARRHGLRVPEDLSIIGFDDTYAAQWTAPPLTTVRQPILDMGRVALRTLLAQARGHAPDSHHVQLATTLVVRGSTARLAT